MKKLAIILLVALTGAGLAPGAAQPAPQGKVVRITLIDENGSGEDGSAQLTDQGDGTTKVELIMLNAPEGAVQPAHIHKGSCANLDPTPAYPLNNIDRRQVHHRRQGRAGRTDHREVRDQRTQVGRRSRRLRLVRQPAAGHRTSSGPMTLDQAFDTLLDQAKELAPRSRRRKPTLPRTPIPSTMPPSPPTRTLSRPRTPPPRPSWKTPCTR